jgi:hypothetical protein
MTIKSIALAAAMLALPLAVSAPMLGGAAHAIDLGGKGGDSSGSADGGNVAASTPAAACVPHSHNKSADAARHANEGCPKSVSIMIGNYRLI